MSIAQANEVKRLRKEVDALIEMTRALSEAVDALREDLEQNYAKKRGPKPNVGRPDGTYQASL